MVRAINGPIIRNSLRRADDLLYRFGSDADAVLVLRSTALSADAEVTDVIVGTSDHQGVAANSFIISNITADGDVGLYVNNGGNSLEALLADASVPALLLGHGMNYVALKNGLNFIGDNANTNMTVGLTINQGASDDNILALKSSDVAHGVTGVVETDTFGYVTKLAATTGGLLMGGLGSGSGAFRCLGVETTAITTKATTSLGTIALATFLKSGTGVTSIGTDGNLVVIVNNATTRFIFDAEGSAHADVEWVAFDKYNDMALLRDFQGYMVTERFGENMLYNLATFERAGIVGKDSVH